MSYCDLPTFYNISEPTAKKPHRCCECRAPINIGEKHLKISGKWDGPPETFRQHQACAEACMLIRDEFEDECIGFGELMEWYGEWRIGWQADHREEEMVKKFRHLMAVILWRERKKP